MEKSERAGLKGDGRVAASPLERLHWIGQVQGHPESTEEDVATAAAIARFVNSKVGHTFISFDALARILGVSRRRLFARLKRLKDRDHITVTRRGRAPPEISAILLPDCIPEVSHGGTSKPCPEVSHGGTSGKQPEVSSGDALRCRDDFVSPSKQTIPDAYNKGITGEYKRRASEIDQPNEVIFSEPTEEEGAPSGARPTPTGGRSLTRRSARSRPPEAGTKIEAPKRKRRTINYRAVLARLDAL